MHLTQAQYVTLKADIQADSALSALAAQGALGQISAAYNAPAVPDFIVWRTSVSESDYTSVTSRDGTNWSWPAFIARTPQEQNGWARMFAATGSVDPSRPNVRQGFQDIFSGAASSAPAQRTHCAAVSKRTATRAEKLFSTGTGSSASPAVLGVEGRLDDSDIEGALRA